MGLRAIQAAGTRYLAIGRWRFAVRRVVSRDLIAQGAPATLGDIEARRELGEAQAQLRDAERGRDRSAERAQAAIDSLQRTLERRPDLERQLGETLEAAFRAGVVAVELVHEDAGADLHDVAPLPIDAPEGSGGLVSVRWTRELGEDAPDAGVLWYGHVPESTRIAIGLLVRAWSSEEAAQVGRTFRDSGGA